MVAVSLKKKATKTNLRASRTSNMRSRGHRSMSSTKITSRFFFFSSRRRHTRLVSDWSSDVCSSDLHAYSRRSFDLVKPGQIIVLGTDGIWEAMNAREE